MIEKKTVLAVVPARGGSKGVPLKNLRTIGGESLIAIVGKVLSQIKCIDRAVISTDHEGIASEGEKADIDVPFRRPESLSGDRISDLDVLTHALKEIERIDGRQYDVIVMLQPTSPLRTASEVEDTVRLLIEDELDSVWTVSPTDSKNHPLKQLTIKNGHLDHYDPDGSSIIARQQLSTVYHRNGAAYAITRSCLLEQKSIMGQHAGAVISEGMHISIDTEWDIELIEHYLKHRKDIDDV